MKSQPFINQAFDYAIKAYMKNEESPTAVNSQNVYIMIIKTLIYIYSEIDIINPYKTNNEKGMGGFNFNLVKYGYPLTEIERFKSDFQNFYLLETKNKAFSIKEKNPYFSEIGKDLVDMYFYRIKDDLSNINEFAKYLYLPKNENSHLNSFNLMTAPNPYEVEKYLNHKINIIKNKLNMIPILENKLDDKIYQHFGIPQEDIQKWNQKQINNVNKQIFTYANTSLTDQELLSKMNQIIQSRKKPKIDITY